MFSASFCLHNVTAVTVQETIFPDFRSLKFTFTNSTGLGTEVIAYIKSGHEVALETLPCRDLSQGVTK